MRCLVKVTGVMVHSGGGGGHGRFWNTKGGNGEFRTQRSLERFPLRKGAPPWALIPGKQIRKEDKINGLTGWVSLVCTCVFVKTKWGRGRT